MHLDAFAVDGIKGVWRKTYIEPANEASIYDSVQFFRPGN
jgi:hypothetical protein